MVKNLPAVQETPVLSLSQKIPRRREWLLTLVFLGYLGGSDSEESPTVRETWVRSLGWEDPLEEGMATHSSILAWRIPVHRGT